MAANNAGDDASGVDLRVTLTDSQVALLDALAGGDGPFDDRDQALQYIIGEYEGLAEREPMAVA